MIRYSEVVGYADEENPLEIVLSTPSPEATSALLLVERLDGVEEEFQLDIDGLVASELSGDTRHARLRIATLTHRAGLILARISTATRGWFRARILWIRDRVPSPGCYLCRQALATLVAAGFAMMGIPMPDLTLGEIFPEEMGENLDRILNEPPLRDFLDQIHGSLAEVLGEAIRNFDLVRKGLGQVYQYCCRLLGLC